MNNSTILLWKKPFFPYIMSCCQHDSTHQAKVSHMKVLKFGGSSLADEKRIAKVRDIISQEVQDDRIAVVFSAMQGVTDMLIDSARTAESGKAGFLDCLTDIRKKHVQTLEKLIGKDSRERTRENLENLFKELEEILHGVQLIRECSLRNLDLIMSFGERMCCCLVTAYLGENGLEAELIDAKEIILTNDHFGAAQVLPASYQKIKKRLDSVRKTAVIPGFIGATEEGVTTTLGRNGSDFTASLIGAGVGSASIEIWTDVDGVLSADPRCVAEAFVIPELSYQEAMELSYFGAKVIHPSTMIPAIEKDIPILIKNTFRPEAPGTLISSHAKPRSTPITGIASIEDVALVNIEGGGMIGIPGIAARILTALAGERVNIIMISQASSEHSICLVFHKRETPNVRRTLENELKEEIADGRIEQPDIRQNLGIIAVIGENMRGTPGISGRLFSSLGDEDINVQAIAQGSSERNISFVAAGEDRERALIAIHRKFLEKEP